MTCIGAIIDHRNKNAPTIVTIFDESKLPALIPQILAHKRWNVSDMLDTSEPSAERICLLNSPHFYHTATLQVVTGSPPSMIHYERRWEKGFTDGVFRYRTVVEPIAQAVHKAAEKTERQPHEVGLYCRVNNATRLEIPTWMLLELAQQ